MSQAVAHLDEMTQANAALAEQSAASAGALSSRIGELNALVAAFRTGPEGAASPARSEPAPMRLAPPRSANDAAPAARASSPRTPPPASEPERLRKLAEAAFIQTRAAPTPRHTQQPAPRKTANSRAADAGWEEF
jgi:methyl-accepting chemotaxis protein